MKTCPGQSAEILDVERAMSRVGGDIEFLLEMVGIIRAACPTLSEEIRQAMARGDMVAVEKNAYLFRAAAENLSAQQTSSAALQLEKMAQRKALKSTREAWQELERELARLTPRLAAFEDALWFAQR